MPRAHASGTLSCESERRFTMKALVYGGQIGTAQVCPPFPAPTPFRSVVPRRLASVFADAARSRVRDALVRKRKEVHDEGSRLRWTGRADVGVRPRSGDPGADRRGGAD